MTCLCPTIHSTKCFTYLYHLHQNVLCIGKEIMSLRVLDTRKLISKKFTFPQQTCISLKIHLTKTLASHLIVGPTCTDQSFKTLYSSTCDLTWTDVASACFTTFVKNVQLLSSIRSAEAKLIPSGLLRPQNKLH